MSADPAQAHVAAEFKHDSPLVCCRFDPLGRYVFAGAEDRSVQRFSLADGAKSALTAHESWVRGMAFSPDGQTLITGGYDGRLIWWPAADARPQPIRIVEAHRGWVRSLAMSGDGKILASGGNDNLVKLWNAGDGTPIRELAGHEAHVYSVLFHPSGELLVSGDLKGQVKAWSVATGEVARSFDAKALHSFNGGQGVDFGGVRSLALSPDLKQLAAAGLHNASNPLGAVHDPLVVRFDWETQQPLKSHVAADLKGVAWRTQFHPDGFLFAAAGGSTGGHLLFWRAEEEKEFFRFALPNIARDCDLHPDSLQIATAHHDRTLRIVKLAPKG
jgi:WD40 repeat protein